MKTLLTLFISFFSLSAFAQVPEPAMLSLKVIGGNGSDEVLTHATKTSDGGFIISYETTSITGPITDSLCGISNPNIIFQKYNTDASVLEWTKCYAANGDTFLEYIFPTNDGGNVFGGAYKSGYGWGFYISKHDALDNIIWSHGYSEGNSPLFFDMKKTSDSGYIMVGQVFYVDTNFTIHYGDWTNADIGILKLDSLGNKVWSKVIGGSGDDHVSSVVEGTDNSCFIVGTTPSNDYDCTGNHGGENDVYIARLDVSGNLLWHLDLGGTDDDVANSAIADGKGGVTIAGATFSSDGNVTHLAGPGENMWVLNIDSNNNIVWNNCYGGGGDCYANSVCKATDGSIWIAGVTNTKTGEIDTVYGLDDAWFVHADSAGNFLSAKVLGSSLWDYGQMIYPLSNGNVIAGGFYDAGNGAFPNIFYGEEDAFLTIFAPWDQTGVKQVSLINNDAKICPNPANEYVNITTEQTGNYFVVITDVIGKTVYEACFNNKIQIPVKDWVEGMYYVQVRSEDGYGSVQKLIVE